MVDKERERESVMKKMVRYERGEDHSVKLMNKSNKQNDNHI